MALEQRTKYIVFNEGFLDVAVKDSQDPTIDDFDYAIPVTYMEKETGPKRAERLPPVSLIQPKGRGVVTLG